MLTRTRERPDGFLNSFLKSKAGMWFPDMDLFVPKRRNVLGVLGKPEGKILLPASNIVTNAGDLHYAQRAVSEALTNAFGVHLMATAGPATPSKTDDLSALTEVAASEKATDTGYPTRDDTDTKNTGAGTDVVTHKVAYTTGDFNATGISHGTITNATPGTTEPLLTSYAFASSFDKTSSDTLDVFVNHTMSGQ